jgi:hypothetical protein
MDNLFLAFSSSSLLQKEKHGLFVLSYPAWLRLKTIPVSGKKCPESTGTGGRNRPEFAGGNLQDFCSNITII